MSENIAQWDTELEKAAAVELPAASEFSNCLEIVENPNPASQQQRAEIMNNLAFGKVFTDHMVHAKWDSANGWTKAKVVPYGNISLSPAAAVLHYSQEVFEGLKAYRHQDGSIWSFRPAFNAARFNASSLRLSMPEMPINDFVSALVNLVQVDREWVPNLPGSSLYLRPFAFASEPFLGVRSSQEIDFYVIASPVGPYFANGFEPVSIWVSTDFNRAGPGGTGSAKTGGNYASSLLAQSQAGAKGYDQVCFLDAATRTNIDELGGMNVFVVRADGTVQTPRLGTILEGGTRSSIARLLQRRGHQVTQENIALTDLVKDIENGAVSELFACGTAAVVTPIGRLGGEEFDVKLDVGPVTKSVYNELTDIQLGKSPDPYGWTYRLV